MIMKKIYLNSIKKGILNYGNISAGTVQNPKDMFIMLSGKFKVGRKHKHK